MDILFLNGFKRKLFNILSIKINKVKKMLKGQCIKCHHILKWQTRVFLNTTTKVKEPSYCGFFLA